MTEKKHVYFFSEGNADGNTGMKEILGGKGANLAEMGNLGIPIPPGFTISAEICRYYHQHDSQYPPGLRDEVQQSLNKLEEATGKRFGDPDNPLLVSVRSGAAISMPGMMDTVLNVGLNDRTLEGLIEKTDNPRFGWDAYRRLLQMFGNVVKGIEHERFDEVILEAKREQGVQLDTELDADDLKAITEQFKTIYREVLNEDFPQEPEEQLWQAIDAVFESWNIPRAIKYREIHHIPHDAMGTAVNVQTMVFGNAGENSATGVAFTRNPATGERHYYGEYLRNAQGEDVVAGIRTPRSIVELETEMPQAYKELVAIFDKLEQHYQDIQDVEFTIEDSKLYMLQTRIGKRTAQAAVKIAVDMVNEGLIPIEEVLKRIEPEQLDQLLHPSFDPKQRTEPIAKGLNASPGAAVGRVVFSADDAQEWAKTGEEVILVRNSTSPDDIHGLEAAEGVLTSRGGLTSHAAIVARGMGKPGVVGSETISIDYQRKQFTVDGTVVREGDYLSIDGTTGEVMLGQVPLIEPQLDENFETLMNWTDGIRKLGVWTNADTPKDAQLARQLGAEGIGLARTEHMFFGEERLSLFQEAIIARSREERERSLKRLGEIQKEDFKGLLSAMEGLPVIIRLLDPPLHEFLPHEDGEIEWLAKSIGVSADELSQRIQGLEEFNPMLGHRGCRLGITTPEIYDMQVEAIIRASCELKQADVDARSRIMVPLVGVVEEIRIIKDRIQEIADRVMEEVGVQVDYQVGTMIELPRACVTADEIAEEAEFFSFGTNDLTQMTYGYSRDDVAKFLPAYDELGILKDDPFATLDTPGVGELMRIGVERGRSVQENLSIGICGEHGGDERSIHFCHQLGIDYVSCSPYRVPIARLAAAQAVLGRYEAYTA
ncbi:MAG: pyruvate, phosphate dikinase [Candidatus Bipolaricaulia bacterium]